jgi:hypothetical protein
MGAPSLCVLFAVGCAAHAKNPLASDTFGGMNMAAIQYDCGESRQCADDEDRKPAANFVDTCITMEASQFASHPESQARFLNIFNRCNLFKACGYRDCTKPLPDGSITPGYGESVAPQITFGCAQKVQCQVDQGKPVDNAMLQINNCVGATEGAFFHFANSDRSAYESAFNMCSPLVSCAFVGCYLY